MTEIIAAINEFRIDTLLWLNRSRFVPDISPDVWALKSVEHDRVESRSCYASDR